MNAEGAKAHRLSPFCVTMLSPGAAWQCAVIPHFFQYRAVVHLADRYEKTVCRRECSFRSQAVTRQDGALLPQISSLTFRLRTSAEKGIRYLSGSTDTGKAGNLLWDIRLNPVLSESGCQLFLASGRVVFADREYLFPAVSSFLLIDENMDRACAAGCAQDPLRAFCAGEGNTVAAVAGRTRKALSGFTLLEPSAMQIPGMPDPLIFRASDPSPDTGFRVKLRHGLQAETRFGSWSACTAAGGVSLPGFIISVI